MLSNFYSDVARRLVAIVGLLNEFEGFALQEGMGKDPTETREFVHSHLEEILAGSKPIRELLKKYVEIVEGDEDEIQS